MDNENRNLRVIDGGAYGRAKRLKEHGSRRKRPNLTERQILKKARDILESIEVLDK
jgi:hypothetical protein